MSIGDVKASKSQNEGHTLLLTVVFKRNFCITTLWKYSTFHNTNVHLIYLHNGKHINRSDNELYNVDEMRVEILSNDLNLLSKYSDIY